MIEVSIDHSYEENYSVISSITVSIADPEEKKRIENAIEELGLIQQEVYGGKGLRKELAKKLKVDVNIIDIDTNEIDI